MKLYGSVLFVLTVGLISSMGAGSLGFDGDVAKRNDIVAIVGAKNNSRS